MRLAQGFMLLLVGLAFSTTTVFAASEALEGEWQCATNPALGIAFYGNQIGCSSTNGVERYFQYLSAGTNSLSLNFGGGEQKMLMYEQDGDSLTITEDSQRATCYTLIHEYTNLCQKGLSQIIGAQHICRKDAPTARMIPTDYMLRYLQAMPICPNGGTYFLQPGQDPRCSSTVCNP